jgi:hypothetical protein
MFCNLAYTVGAHQSLDPAANVYDNDRDGKAIARFRALPESQCVEIMGVVT